MENIIWEMLWSEEKWNKKNYLYFLKSVLKLVWIKKLSNKVSIKNHRFIEILSLLNEEITYVSSNIDLSWYKIKNMFLIEDEDLKKYLELNKKTFQLAKR